MEVRHLSSKLVRWIVCIGITIVAGALLTANSYCQLTVPSKVISKSYVLKATVPVHEMPAINLDSLLTVRTQDIEIGKSPQIGVALKCNVSLQQGGVWENVDGGRVWRTRIVSPGANAIALNLSRYWLPPDARLFVFNPIDSTPPRGAYSEINNNENGKLSIGMVVGDVIVLEYFEPTSVAQTGVLEIASVVHVFGAVPSAHPNLKTRPATRSSLDFGDSESCHINVMCSEGEPYRDQARSVVMIAYDEQTRVCSGVLVNNTSEDELPYVLTGNDAIRPGFPYNEDYDEWMFYFNYVQASCDSAVDGTTALRIDGADCKSWGYLFLDQPDFRLLLLNDTIPDYYHAYFAGWSNVDSATDSTFCIHHPAGDVQKISFAGDSTTSSNYSPYHTDGDDFWSVTYHPNAGTGVVESGSEGAPLFDQNKRIIGTLFMYYYSAPYCNLSSLPTSFAKFATAWDAYPDSIEQLAYWLDPTNTNATTLDGLDPVDYCCVGMRGNVNNDEFDAVDLSDLTYLVNYLYLGGPPPECWTEGNCDGDAKESIDVSDVSKLIDHLFLSFEPLPDCPY